MGNDGWKYQPKKMNEQTLARIADQLSLLCRIQKKAISVVFHGGEPLLVGSDRFESMCRILRAALPKDCSLYLQTNGVLLSEKIIATCSLYDVGISISIDGPTDTNDQNRVDLRGRGSHSRVLDGIRRLVGSSHGRTLFTGVLAVIDPTSDPIRTYEFLKSTGAPSIDFLYRDGNHDVLPFGKASPNSLEFGKWMSDLLDYYLVDEMPTPVRVLDDMIKLQIGGTSRKEGIGTSEYGILVIETDGTLTKNDTLKSASRLADKFDQASALATENLQDFLSSKEFLEYHLSQKPVSPTCQACSYLTICGGGMPTHRFSNEHGLSNPSIFCADQKHLIDRIKWHLSRRKLAA